VQNAPIVTGWVVYNPPTEQVIEFPTNVQNIVWTRDTSEGSPVDESMTFVVREALSEVASQLPVQEIYGAGKNKVVSARADALSQLARSGAPRPPARAPRRGRRGRRARRRCCAAERTDGRAEPACGAVVDTSPSAD